MQNFLFLRNLNEMQKKRIMLSYKKVSGDDDEEKYGDIIDGGGIYRACFCGGNDSGVR